MTRRLMRARSGAVAVLTALLAVPLIAIAGMAIDGGRLWLVQSRLQTAVDAGTLAIAKALSAGGTKTDGVALFWSDFGRTSKTTNQGYLGAVATAPVVTQPSNGIVQMTATAVVATPLMNVLGLGPVTVRATATAESAASGLEVALVLDNTGSMAGWPIQSVISSATDLVNILYGTGTADTQPNLWVSVVPFSAELNIGPTHTGWLAAGSYNASAYKNTTWMGCVMARVQNGNDFTDATPAQAPFSPFLYPSTLGVYKVGKTTITGDDDWSTTHITEQNQATLPENTAVGPNLGCPNLPVLPETASRTTVLAEINKMVPNYRGGTFINLGLQAGWWTLSPNWQGLWGNASLPLAYGTPHMKKVIVLMTDGNNEWYDWTSGAPGVGPYPWVNDGDTDYTAYGRLKMNLMGLSNVTQGNATTTLNTRMSQMCTIIKNAGIIIYTVLFDHDAVDASTQTLFQTCASSPQDYYLTPTDAQLQSAFQQIGSQLSSLRLVQ